jgi:hypothetical protein
MKAAKAWVALIALVITNILISGVLPNSGNWHIFWAIATVVGGTLATWAVPNATPTQTPFPPVQTDGKRLS